MEPAQRLNDELRKQGVSEMQFFLLKHGESRLIEIKEAEKQEDAAEQNGNVDDNIEDDKCAEQKKADEDDASILQQLVDNLAEETQPEAEQHHDGENEE